MNKIIKEIRIRPVIKWAGGKSQLIESLIRYAPEQFNDYFEPFFGSGAFFLALNPKGVSYINDINQTLMSLYSLIRNGDKQLVAQLEEMQEEYNCLHSDDQQKYYYTKRARYNSLPSQGIERAALFVFLNKAGYNGMYRENSKGEFNIPFGKHNKINLFSQENLNSYGERLKKTKITSVQYYETLTNIKEGDFVYLDPPYHPISTSSSFTSYHKTDFNKIDQIRLADLVKKLTKKNCKVMLSNSNHSFITEELFGDRNLYNCYPVSANRFINCKGSARGRITEVIITNYKDKDEDTTSK